MNTPLVSISCIAFNHSKYIRKCLDGFLMQKTNFRFEILIHDDASDDGTQQIIKDYQKKFPDLIFPLFQKENQYSKGKRGVMSRYNFPRAKGKYIALCEGDDYWTDPYKLQKQVDFLEANEDFSLCFHAVKEVDVQGNEMPTKMLYFGEVEKEYDILDLAKGNFIHTPSVVFRKKFDSLPVWFQFSPIGDYPLYMICAQYGKIKYMTDPMANYRVGSGIWSTKKYKHQVVAFIQVLDLLIDYFSDQKTIRKVLENTREKIFENIAAVAQLEIKEIADKLSTKSILKLLAIKISRIATFYTTFFFSKIFFKPKSEIEKKESN